MGSLFCELKVQKKSKRLDKEDQQGSSFDMHKGSI